MKPAAGSLAVAALVAGAAAYAVLTHELMLRATAQAWTVIIVLGPLLATTAALAWRARRWLLLCAAALGAALLAWLVAIGAVATVDLLYVLQHTGIYLVLGIGFALTLRQPLSMIGRLAERVHADPLTPAVVTYTRNVTWAWTIFFFAMSGLSVLVYLAAPWEAWSLLSNVLTPIATGLMFVGEYLLRYRIHPEFERVSLSDTVGSWRKRSLAPEVRER